jgi:hypothetical protein
MEPRSLRRWRARFEAGGAVALYDRRQLPSPRKAPALEVQRRHAWLRGCPDEPHTLIAVREDATKRLLYAQLWPAESTVAVMTALRTVFTRDGLAVALYTDRDGWAFHTPQAGGRVDRTRLNPGRPRPRAVWASSTSPPTARRAADAASA